MLLDVARWDVCLNADKNIAVASDPYSVAQDVASACRTWLGEVFYDTTLGVPYAQTFLTVGRIMGRVASLAFIKAQLEAAALKVPGVANPKAFVSSLSDRVLTGSIQFTDTNTGATLSTSIGF